MKAFGQGGRQRKQPQVYRSKPPTWHTALGSQISSASAIPLPQVLIPEGSKTLGHYVTVRGLWDKEVERGKNNRQSNHS